MANKNNKKNKTNLERRDLLKGLAGVPVAGFFLLNLWQKIRRNDFMIEQVVVRPQLTPKQRKSLMIRSN